MKDNKELVELLFISLQKQFPKLKEKIELYQDDLKQIINKKINNPNLNLEKEFVNQFKDYFKKLDGKIKNIKKI